MRTVLEEQDEDLSITTDLLRIIPEIVNEEVASYSRRQNITDEVIEEKEEIE